MRQVRSLDARIAFGTLMLLRVKEGGKTGGVEVTPARTDHGATIYKSTIGTTRTILDLGGRAQHQWEGPTKRVLCKHLLRAQDQIVKAHLVEVVLCSLEVRCQIEVARFCGQELITSMCVMLDSSSP